MIAVAAVEVVDFDFVSVGFGNSPVADGIVAFVVGTVDLAVDGLGTIAVENLQRLTAAVCNAMRNH